MTIQEAFHAVMEHPELCCRPTAYRDLNYMVAYQPLEPRMQGAGTFYVFPTHRGRSPLHLDPLLIFEDWETLTHAEFCRELQEAHAQAQGH